MIIIIAVVIIIIRLIVFIPRPCNCDVVNGEI